MPNVTFSNVLIRELMTQRELNDLRASDFQTWARIMSPSPYDRPILMSKPIEVRPMSEAEPYRMDDVYTPPTLFSIRSVEANPPMPPEPQPMCYYVTKEDVQWLAKPPAPLPARFVRAWFWVVRSTAKIFRHFRRIR